MSIGKRVTDSFEKMLRGDAEGALFAICAAVEETARREGRLRGKRSFKEFITDNFNIISGIGFGNPVKSLSIHYTHPDLPASPGGVSRFDDILYHVIRCGLYHAAALPENVSLTENVLGHDGKGTLQLPKNIVSGLIVAVVASPGNAGERTNPSFYFETIAGNFILNDIWGKQAEVKQRLIDAANRRASGDGKESN